MQASNHPTGFYQGELYTKHGHLLITSRQLMAINALLDTPNGEVTSIAEWHLLVRRYGEYLHRDTVWGFPTAWVTVKRVGPRVIARINPRARMILLQQVPLHVRGYGPISSVSEWLGRHNLRRSK